MKNSRIARFGDLRFHGWYKFGELQQISICLVRFSRYSKQKIVGHKLKPNNEANHYCVIGVGVSGSRSQKWELLRFLAQQTTALNVETMGKIEEVPINVLTVSNMLERLMSYGSHRSRMRSMMYHGRYLQSFESINYN